MTELLPTTQAHDVQQGLTDYLTTTFALADTDARLALHEFLTDAADGIFKGPYLRLRLPFRPAAQGWQRSLDWQPSLTPYGHQAAAYARLTSADLGPGKPRPLPTVVTTGTGSGKTEAFLHPILDHVLRMRRAGQGGIKALILYPMNALANDQAGRLAALISGDPTLAGVTAAVYTGQQVAEAEKRSQVTAAGLINQREYIRDDPPDILLTNYKMLDQLLLRPADQPLWRASAESLQYLVLDEFHTYDGAQGTDVAMLLRRLGLALAAHLPPDHARHPAVTGRPLGMLTPVATSATLGDKGDPAAVLDFAVTVFGENFTNDCVITESRFELAGWLPEAERQVRERGLVPVLPADFTGLPQLNDELDAALRADVEAFSLHLLAALYETPDQGEVAPVLGDVVRQEGGLLMLVAGHPGLRALIAECEQAVHLDELAPRFLEAATAPDPRTHAAMRHFLLHVVALLSHVRAGAGRAAPNVDLHLWVRELTRIDRAAGATATYLWSDDGALTVTDVADLAETEGRPAFPAIFCRHCGRSGWGVGLAATGTDLDADDSQIRRRHAMNEGRFRALLFAPLEADHAILGDRRAGVPAGQEVEGLRWFAVRRRAIITQPPPDDDPEFSDGWVLPVLTLTGPEADAQSRDDTCPSCLQADGIRFLGSAIATLLSVSLATLFGNPTLDPTEKKALVFTDSVQDAAHRAGFVQSRSHTLTLRTVLRDALGDAPATLDQLVEQAVRAAGDDPFDRYRLVPPDLVERPEFAPFWQRESARAVPVGVARRVRQRLLFDAVLEFGLASRIGRTLESTGSAVAEVTAPEGLAVIARSVIGSQQAGDQQEALFEGLDDLTDQRLAAWVRGVLERMRERGAIEHPWFHAYLTEDGNRYRIWGGRPKGQGMPAFPRGRSAPAFPRVGAALPGVTDPLLDSVTGTQSWYARWTARLLSVNAQHAARLARALLERLARDGVLQAFATRSQATVYAVPHTSVLVAPVAASDLAAAAHLLECRMCRSRFPGTTTVVDQLDGAPCLLVRCPGVLQRAVAGENYYRRLYGAGDPRRIVAREHSSLLDDQTRVEYEQAFKASHPQPRSPNVLVATPTLEMGIDIGDLSTVILASLPRTVASYLQRVGRAGRLTGNALNLAFVTGRGEHLPRLGDPLSVVNGQVRPPATYLNAEEILQRQYVAHLVDLLARSDDPPSVRVASQVLAATEPGSFLGRLIDLAEQDAEAHLSRFLGQFTLAGVCQISQATVAELRRWATAQAASGSGLATHLHAVSKCWSDQLEELGHRVKAIQAALPQLKQVAELPAATDDDLRAYRSAQAALTMTRGQRSGMRDQPWVQALEEHGVLPNYTLLDDAVTLEVGVTWIDPDTQEYQSSDVSYRRASANALREFAPGAVFYARGLEIDIDSVDLGIEGSAVRPWAFCPACGYAVDRGPGGATVPVPACPRCGSPAISDTKQHVDAVELTRVSAELRRDEAAINDRSDVRRHERFTIFVAADLDPASITRRWFVQGYEFGCTYLRRLDIRWVNAGRGGGYGPAVTIAGRAQPAAMFRVCAGCGVLDKATQRNRPDEHRPWCRYRRAAQEEVRTVALMRTLSTQGVVLRLPPSLTIGDSFAVPSLAAALLLGLHEQLGGQPDHLAVVQITDPVLQPGGGTPYEALLVHDVVPGGTGYLAELADPARLRDLLIRAWRVVRDCPCRDEHRLACHRCLLPFAGGMQASDRVSRQVAERHLRAILLAGQLPGQTEPADEELEQLLATPWQITDLPTLATSSESYLEQNFRRVFTARVGALGAKVQEVPGPHGIRLKITGIGGRLWMLEPQELMHGCKPDFVLRTQATDVPDVAIFTDGRQFHATPANNRLLDDAQKRRALRDQGVVVLGVTHADVEQADPAAGRGPAAPAWAPEPLVAQVLQSGQYQIGSRALESLRAGPFGFLMAWLTAPQLAEFTGLAEALPLLFAAGAQPVSVPVGGSTHAAGRLLAGALPVATGDGLPAHWCRPGGHPALGALLRLAGGSVEVVLVLDDRAESLAHEGHAAAWAEWLRIANLIGLRQAPLEITTLTEALAATAQSEPEPEPAVAVPAVAGPWQALVDGALSDAEADLLRGLAAAGSVPLPQIGADLADGIPVELSWVELKVAVLIENYTHEDQVALEAAGWKVLPAEVDAVVAALVTQERR